MLLPLPAVGAEVPSPRPLPAPWGASCSHSRQLSEEKDGASPLAKRTRTTAQHISRAASFTHRQADTATSQCNSVYFTSIFTPGSSIHTEWGGARPSRSCWRCRRWNRSPHAATSPSRFHHVTFSSHHLLLVNCHEATYVCVHKDASNHSTNSHHSAKSSRGDDHGGCSAGPGARGWAAAGTGLAESLKRRAGFNWCPCTTGVGRRLPWGTGWTPRCGQRHFGG